MPHDHETADQLRAGMTVSVISIVWTLIASTISIVIGVQASNLVLVAFGCTGLLDAAGSVALVIHFRHALKHETFSETRERVAFLVVNGGLVVVAVSTVVDSIIRLAQHTHGHSSMLGVGVAASSAVVLTILARRKMQLGRLIPSQALFADGMLSTTGAVLAVITVLGTLLAGIGLWWADPVAALLVAVGAMGVAIILARQESWT